MQTTSLPDFPCCPPAKLVRLISEAEANCAELHRVRAVAATVRRMGGDASQAPVLRQLLPAVSTATGMPQMLSQEWLVRAGCSSPPAEHLRCALGVPARMAARIHMQFIMCSPNLSWVGGVRWVCPRSTFADERVQRDLR